MSNPPDLMSDRVGEFMSWGHPMSEHARTSAICGAIAPLILRKSLSDRRRIIACGNAWIELVWWARVGQGLFLKNPSRLH